MWMVRAEGGTLFERFVKGVVAVGWAVGDLTVVDSRERIREVYEVAYPQDGHGRTSNAVAALYKFRAVLAPGDKVVTYNPEDRQYLVGDITGGYRYSTKVVGAEWPHVRDVKWLGRVERDALSSSTRNTLGSTLTLFSINEDAAGELLAALESSGASARTSVETETVDDSTFREEETAKAFELVKDAIVRLDDREAEELVAAVLRAMGYRARVSPVGSDRGVDVLASPDGIGLQQPRIKAEVKHRPRSAMGAQEIRSFIGGLRPGDCGLYVSTGSFTREARYEADRSSVPLTLITLDDLAALVVTHYEEFDVPGQVILPLFRVYLPEK